MEKKDFGSLEMWNGKEWVEIARLAGPVKITEAPRFCEPGELDDQVTCPSIEDLQQSGDLPK